MSDTNGKNDKSTLRKLAIPLIVGGISGFLMVMGVTYFTEGESLSSLSGAAEAAIIVGAFYILMGLGVGFGAARPSIGSKILNVEDAEELEEQKSVLLNSCVGMTLWGVALIVVALGGEGGVIVPVASVAIAIVAVVIGSYFAWLSYRASDELMAAVNSESSALAYFFSFAVIGGWAMASHVGLIRPQEPIETLTVFYVLVLIATFWAAGRRGMLAVR